MLNQKGFLISFYFPLLNILGPSCEGPRQHLTPQNTNHATALKGQNSSKTVNMSCYSFKGVSLSPPLCTPPKPTPTDLAVKGCQMTWVGEVKMNGCRISHITPSLHAAGSRGWCCLTLPFWWAVRLGRVSGSWAIGAFPEAAAWNRVPVTGSCPTITSVSPRLHPDCFLYDSPHLGIWLGNEVQDITTVPLGLHSPFDNKLSIDAVLLLRKKIQTFQPFLSANPASDSPSSQLIVNGASVLCWGF